MSEITLIKCDQSGCEKTVTAYPTFGTDEAKERALWEKDDLDADICPACQARMKALESESDVDLETFGKVVSAAADQAAAEIEAQGVEVRPLDTFDPNDAPPPIPEKVVELPDNFDKILEDVVENTRKDLKKQKKSKAVIDETIRLIREEGDRMRAAAKQRTKRGN